MRKTVTKDVLRISLVTVFILNRVIGQNVLMKTALQLDK